MCPTVTLSNMSGMQKARKYDIGETNIAGLGTPLEKAIREASAGHEDAVSTTVGRKACIGTRKK